MSKLSQYMFKKYLIGFILAISVLLSINLLVVFLSELKNLGNHQYDFSTLAQYIIMLIPLNFLDTFPYALLIGSMIAFGSMAHHSEIVAINSHGVGIKKTISLILIQTFLLASFFSYLGNALSPSFTSYAYEVKNSALLKSNSTKELWFKGQDVIIHAKSIITAKHLKGIEIYYVNDGVMTSTVSAKKAEYYNKNWNLIDAEITDIINNSIFKKKSLSISTEEFIPFQIIKSSFNKKRHNSIQDLYENIRYFDNAGLYYEDHKITFWQKVLLPFSCCIIVFISIPFLFTKARSKNQSQRLIYGILFGITYFVISSIIINICLILTIPALISVLISMGVFILLGYFLFEKLVKSHTPI
jgi:lipopolysaccharide export system permease protein